MVAEKEISESERKALRIEFTDAKPNKPIIIEGFPGFGFVSTIATEFLVKTLNAKPIGRIVSEKLLPIAAIHKAEVVYPLEIFYDKKTNIIIVQAVTPVEGLEWRLADAIVELAKEVNAKEIVSLEGVAATGKKEEDGVFFYTNREDKKKHLLGITKELQEGVILGVTGALLMKTEKVPFSCFFAEAQNNLPDNRAAVKLIDLLNKYLGLSIDCKPLAKHAEEVEEKLKTLIGGMSEAQAISDQKMATYTG